MRPCFGHMQKSRPANRRLASSALDARYLNTSTISLQSRIGHGDLPTAGLGARRLNFRQSARGSSHDIRTCTGERRRQMVRPRLQRRGLIRAAGIPGLEQLAVGHRRCRKVLGVGRWLFCQARCTRVLQGRWLRSQSCVHTVEGDFLNQHFIAAKVPSERQDVAAFDAVAFSAAQLPQLLREL